MRFAERTSSALAAIICTGILMSVALPARAGSITVVVLGSSTAAGAFATPVSQSWVNRYTAYLQGLDPANRVVNLAVGGYTTYHVMPTGFVPPVSRPGPDTARNITAALALHPNAVIVNLPSNDATNGYSNSEQESNFQAIYAAAEAANVPIWIGTTQPRNGTATQRASLKTLRDWIFMTFGPRALDFWSTVATPDATIVTAYDSGDGTHFNNAGHDVLYQRVVNAAIPTVLATPTVPDPGNPYGDVDGDGTVGPADAGLVAAYLLDPATLTPAEQDRVRRYGDVCNAVNRTTIGNGVLDVNDTMRLMLMTGGQIDAGTAGPTRPDYGDVNGDGHVDIADAVLAQRAINNLVSDPAILDRVHARGLGDVSPTVPFVSFGHGTVDQTDLAIVSARANGAEAVPPAYVDYWPLHAPDPLHPDVVADQCLATDVNSLSGDALHRVSFTTGGIEERRGYTVTRFAGSDGTILGLFKSMNGSVNALYVDYPFAFGNRRLEFASPVTLLDEHAARGEVSSWNACATGAFTDSPSQNVKVTGTVLSRGDVYTPAAGDFVTVTPQSTWSKSLRIRLDVAVLRGQPGTMDMQQALFYEFAPFVGMVQYGQAPLQGMTAEATDRPLLLVTQATSRGITYSPSAP